MALGDLSPDQLRYASAVAAGTGLDATVVKAWVGAESGWNVTKATHNYLNVGPGWTFPSTDQAAAKVVSLINTSSNYAGIRAAIPGGPWAQVKAIEASPWDAGNYQRAGGPLLSRVYSALSGSPMTDTAAAGATATPVGLSIPNPFDAGGDAIAGALGKLIEPFTDAFLKAALTTVFSLAGLGLVAIGITRLAGVRPTSALDGAMGLAGSVGQARTIASAAAV